MTPVLRTLSRVGVTLAAVALAAAGIFWMWHHYEVEPWTRDGRVRADVVRVAPDVSGLVTNVLVKDNQDVERGQPLFKVDPPRYRLGVAEAEAALASARATLAQARREAERNNALGDLVSREEREQGEARVLTAAADLRRAETALDVARLDLERTVVRASVNGIVTNLQLRPGDYVTAGAQALALVDTDSLRVEGYFEEDKLPRIHVGDRVTVRLMGEEETLTGRVESIAAGIADQDRGASPNLLPAVNPTFAWVRLPQRIPVRVALDEVPDHIHLIPGRTATVAIIEEQNKEGRQRQGEGAPR